MAGAQPELALRPDDEQAGRMPPDRLRSQQADAELGEEQRHRQAAGEQHQPAAELGEQVARHG